MCEFNLSVVILPLILVSIAFLVFCFKYDSFNPIDWMEQFVKNRKYQREQKDKKDELYRIVMNNNVDIKYLINNRHDIQRLLDLSGMHPFNFQYELTLLQKRITRLEEQLESKRGRK